MSDQAAADVNSHTQTDKPFLSSNQHTVQSQLHSIGALSSVT